MVQEEPRGGQAVLVTITPRARMAHVSNRHTFRARNLDPARPLDVYRRDELVTRSDFVQGDRAMPTMASGMDAEEETEHHLQRAIATETLSTGKKFIPTPDALPIEVDYYKELYTDVRFLTRRWKQGYILQELTLLDENPPEYNLDSEDEDFRATLANPSVSELELETMLDQLEDSEQSRGQLAPFCREWSWGRGIIGDSVHSESVHQYWVKKRTKLSGPIKYRLLREKPIDTNSVNESYVCFRRRLDRIQTRRNKQRDQMSYTRMVKLRRDLMKLLNLCKLMKQREETKNEIVEHDFKIIQTRLSASDFKNQTIKKYKMQQEPPESPQENPVNGFKTNNDYPVRPPGPNFPIKIKPKRPKKPGGGESLRVEATNDPSMSSKYSFKHDNAKPGAFYLEERSLSQILERDSKDGEPHEGYRLLSTEHRTLGLCRRRLGRGGRMLTDRAFHPNHQVLTQLNLPSSDPELALIPADANETPAAHQMRSILDDIKKQRVRHFQPGEPRKRKRMNPSKKR